jgi:hypothetical protein
VTVSVTPNSLHNESVAGIREYDECMNYDEYRVVMADILKMRDFDHLELRVFSLVPNFTRIPG